MRPDDPRHGTRNGYTNLGCRCSACREAQAVYHAAWRAKQTPLSPDDSRHGVASTYCNYGCRCQPCTEADRLAARRSRGKVAS